MAERRNKSYKGIRSKHLVAPKKYIAVFNKILYTGVGLIVIGEVIAFVLSGFQFATLLGIAVPVSIAYGYSRQDFARKHYDFCLLDLEIGDEKVMLRYYLGSEQGEVLKIHYKSIVDIQCVEELSCIRLDRQEVVKGRMETAHMLVFLEKEVLQEIYKELKCELEKST